MIGCNNVFDMTSMYQNQKRMTFLWVRVSRNLEDWRFWYISYMGAGDWNHQTKLLAPCFCSVPHGQSLTNNRMGAESLKNRASGVGSKGWNWYSRLQGVRQYPWWLPERPLKDRGTFQRSPFKLRAAAISPSFFSVSFRPYSEGRRKEGRFSRLVIVISYYKSPLNREEGPVGPWRSEFVLKMVIF